MKYSSYIVSCFFPWYTLNKRIITERLCRNIDNLILSLDLDNLFVFPSPFLNMFLFLSRFLSICLCMRVSVCVCVILYVCLSMFISLFMSVCLSFGQSHIVFYFPHIFFYVRSYWVQPLLRWFFPFCMLQRIWAKIISPLPCFHQQVGSKRH